MDIEKIGYAAVMYFSEDKETIYFETSEGLLLNHNLSIVSKLLRRSLLKPKTKQVKFEKNETHMKIFMDQGYGSVKEVLYKDISKEHNLENGSVFSRIAA